MQKITSEKQLSRWRPTVVIFDLFESCWQMARRRTTGGTERVWKVG